MALSPVLGSYCLILDGASRSPRAATFHRRTVTVAAVYSWRKVDKRKLWVHSIARARVSGHKLFAEWIEIDKVNLDPLNPLKLVVPESSEIDDQRSVKPRRQRITFNSLPKELKALIHVQSDNK